MKKKLAPFRFSTPVAAVFSLSCALLLASPSAAGIPVQWTGSIEVARGGGERGPWAQNRSRYNYVDDGSVTLDEQGRAHVVWVDQARKRVLYQRYGSNGLPERSEPATVSRSPEEFSWMPRIALAPGNPQRIYVLWQDIIFAGGSHGGDILFARSVDDGASFAEPINLSQSISGAGKGRITREHWHNGSYDIAVAADGAVLVAWTEFEGRLLFARSDDGGVRFGPVLHVAGNERLPARGPTLAAGRGGRVHLAWTVGERADADIMIARSDTGGARFAEPRVAVRTRSYADAPKLALGADGVLHLAFALSAGGPFNAYRVHYTRSADGGQQFETPRDVSSPVPRNAASAHFPHLALDGAGNPVLVWELHPEPLQRPRGLGMAVSRDGGESFSEPATVPGSVLEEGRNGSQQGLLMRKLSVNRAGALAIANSSLRENDMSRVWLLRGQLN